MTTKVFISWSGDLSNKLAEEVRQWLPGVLQFVKPYFTPSDIEKGARWANDIVGELNDSDIGIICLTKENLQKDWILFEAGALSKNFDKSRVCTLLFGVDSTDISGPLTIFQNTKFEKSDFKKLVKTINGVGGETKLEDSVFNKVFDMWWPKLQANIDNILKGTTNKTDPVIRSERELLEELLSLTRLNMRRGRPDRKSISSMALEHLSESFDDVAAAVEQNDYEMAREALAEMDRPLSYIIRYLGSDSLIESYNSSFVRELLSKKRLIGADTQDISDLLK